MDRSSRLPSAGFAVQEDGVDRAARKTRAQPGCPTCFEQNDGYSYLTSYSAIGCQIPCSPVTPRWRLHLPSQRSRGGRSHLRPRGLSDQATTATRPTYYFRKIGAE